MEDEKFIDSLLEMNVDDEKKSQKNNNFIDSILPDSNISYDNQFLEESKDNIIFRPSQVSDDYINIWDNLDNTKELRELQAQRQSWASKASSGIARAGVKAAAEVVKVPVIFGGILAGTAGQVGDLISGEDNTDFMQTAFNNSWVKGINDINEEINEEYLPVYIKEAVKNGDLMTQLTSIGTWATEGADAVGFMVGMFAPGAALKYLKVGSGIFKSLRAVEKATGKIDDALGITSKFSKGIDSKIPKLLNKRTIDVGVTSIGNTVVEAGVEAVDAGKELREKAKSEYNSGKITEEEYNQKLEKAGKIERKVFWANAAILLGPNIRMSKFLWGKNVNKGVSKYFDKGFKLTEKELPGVKQTIGQGLKNFGKGAVSEGLVEEGGQFASSEFFKDNANADFGESIGGIVTSYMDMLGTVDGQKAIVMGAIFGGGMSSVMETKQDIAKTKNYNELVKYSNDNISSFTSLFSDDVFKRDSETGEIQRDQEGNPIIDNHKLINKAENLENNSQVSMLYDMALAQGDMDTVEKIRNEAITAHLIMPFISNEELGLDVLRHYLESVEDIDQLASNEGKTKDQLVTGIMDLARNVERDFKNFEDSVTDLTKFIEDKDLKDFDTPDTKKKNKDKFKKQYIAQLFLKNLSGNYISNKLDRYFLENKLKETNRKLDNILEEKGISRSQYDIFKSLPLIKQLEKANKELLSLDTNDSLSQGEISTKKKELIDKKYKIWEQAKGETNDKDLLNDIGDKRVRKLNDELINTSKLLEKNKEENSKFWKDGELEKRYTKFKNAYNKKDKDVEEAEQKTSEIEKAQEEIKNSTTTEEVNNIPKTNTIADPQLQKEKESKKKELEQIKNAEKEYQAKKDEERSKKLKREEADKDLDKDSLADHLQNFKDGETTSVSKDLIKDYINVPEELDSVSIKKIKETDDNIYFTIEGDKKQYKVSKNAPIAPKVTNETFINDTEGSINHDINISKQGETIKNTEEEDAIVNNGAQVLSTNKQTGKPLGSHITKAYMDFERKPINKVGEKVGFIINNDNFKNSRNPLKTEWEKSRDRFKQFQKDEKTLSKEDKELLYDYLPINMSMSDNVYAPIGTKPNEKYTDSVKAFEDSTRNLRVRLVNTLLEGNDISTIKSTIEFQYPGLLQIDKTPQGENAAVNNIFALYHFNGMTDAQKISYIKENIGVVDALGNIQLLDGETVNFKEGNTKEKSKGEIYLMVPMANGRKIPLKLNIEKMTDNHAKILSKLYEIRINNKDIKKTTLIKSLEDKSILKRFKEVFKEEKSAIGKEWRDLTIKDVTDLLLYDNTDSLKTRVKFTGVKGKKGEGSGVFVYGDPKDGGAIISNSEDFNREDFENWLISNKRHNIKLKKKAKESSNASINTSDKYINYLINNKILNTNAVVGEPTFQGQTNIYLNSANVFVEGNKQEISTSIETQIADIERRRQEELIEYDNSIPWETELSDREKKEINAKYDAELAALEKSSEVQKIDANISNSKKDFVPLHEIEGTKEFKKAEEAKKALNKKNNLNVTNEDLKDLRKKITKSKLIDRGTILELLDANSTEQTFKNLIQLARENSINVEEIVKRCNKG